jgi:hypothetical protein
MLKLKDSQDLGAETHVKEQTEAKKRLTEFKGWLTSKVHGKEFTAKTANVTLLFSYLDLQSLEQTKKHIEKNRPDIIVLEEQKNSNFVKMLDGKVGITQYLSECPQIPGEYGIERYMFLRELHKKNVRIEQLDPPGGSMSIEKQKEGAAQSIYINVCIQHGDFEGAVEAVVSMANYWAEIGKTHGVARAKQLAEKIKSGEFKGNVLIESYQLRMRKLLSDELDGVGGVRLGAVYASGGNAADVFGKPVNEVLTPISELVRMHTFGKHPSSEKERLLAARYVIFLMISEVPTERDSQIESSYKSIKLVNQLSYEECEGLFAKLGVISRKNAFEFVDSYLKRKAQGDVSDMLTMQSETADIQLGKETRVTFFFEAHNLSCLKVFKEHVEKNRPNFILLELEKDTRFLHMLRGEISIGEYMRELNYSFTEFTREQYAFLREEYKKGIKIEQLAGGWFSRDLIGGEGIWRKIFASIHNGDFEGAVESELERARIDIEWLNKCERMRAKEIADKIKRGELYGNVLIESGAFHTRVEKFLKEELRGVTNVEKVDAVHAEKEAPKGIFGNTAVSVYRPANELERLYEYVKQPSKERERLLAARDVIFIFIDKPHADVDFGEEINEFEKIKLVNQLSYEECRALSSEIEEMSREVLFEFIDAYLKKRSGAPLRAAEAELIFGGHAVTGSKIDKKRSLVECKANNCDIAITDTKSVSVSWSSKKGFLRKTTHKAVYTDDGFRFKSSGMDEWLSIPEIKENAPYFGFCSDVIKNFKDSGGSIENEDLSAEGLLGIKEVRRASELIREGKLRVDKQDLKSIEEIIKHENEILQAAALAKDAKTLRKHSQVEELFEKRVDKFIENIKTSQSSKVG